MNPLIAVCGLDCSACEAYLATQADDRAAMEQLAAKWRVMYNAPSINVDYIPCDGCLATTGRLGGHCGECDIRACGVARGVVNCAHCAEFDTCGKLANFLEYVPDAKARLAGIRATL